MLGSTRPNRLQSDTATVTTTIIGPIRFAIFGSIIDPYRSPIASTITRAYRSAVTVAFP